MREVHAMYFPGQKAVLEATDIKDVYYTGSITLPDGTVGLVVVLTTTETSGKTYASGEAPQSLYVTDGVQHRHIALQALPTAAASEAEQPKGVIQEADPAEAEQPALEVAPETPEAAPEAALAEEARVAQPEQEAAPVAAETPETDTTPADESARSE